RAGLGEPGPAADDRAQLHHAVLNSAIQYRPTAVLAARHRWRAARGGSFTLSANNSKRALHAENSASVDPSAHVAGCSRDWRRDLRSADAEHRPLSRVRRECAALLGPC